MRSGSCVAKPLATTNTARQPISPFPVKLLIAAVLQYSRVEKLRGCEQRDRGQIGLSPPRVLRHARVGRPHPTVCVKGACFRGSADNNPVLIHKNVGFYGICVWKSTCRVVIAPRGNPGGYTCG